MLCNENCFWTSSCSSIRELGTGLCCRPACAAPVGAGRPCEEERDRVAFARARRLKCHAMALHKHFSEPLPSCLYHGFPGLAPHIAQEASPVQGSEYTLLAAAAPRLLCKTVPGVSPPCCRCHLFILALTKGNHASEKTLYWKGLNLWNVQKNGSTWFKSSRQWVHLKANNQKHKMPPLPQNNCPFLLVYCGRKS